MMNNISPAVQARMNELREKEAAAKAQEEFLKQELIKGIETEVSLKSDEWEAELLFEIEKNPRFTEWLRKKLQNPSAIRDSLAAIRAFKQQGQCDEKTVLLRQALTNYEVADYIIAEIGFFPEHTLENERMRLHYRVLTRIIDSIKATMKEEERIENLKLAEEARIAAEEKAAAYEAWVKRQQAVLDRYADVIRSSIKTPYHSFTGIDRLNPFVMYVRYDTVSKKLRIANWRIDASDTKVEIITHIDCPPSMKAPNTWNKMFEEGKLPFLTCCPVCSDQIQFQIHRGYHESDIWNVACVKEGHYSWDPVKNQNYKYKYVPQTGPPTFFHHISYRPEAWDPRDPDGSIAAAAAHKAKIAAKEAEIAKLQAELEVLRKGCH